jgi:hypothetical protein
VSECLPHSLEVRHDEQDGDGGWICVGRTAAGGGSGDHGKGALLLGDDGRRAGSVNARPMSPQKSPASEDPFGILFLTRRGSRKALEIGRTGRLSVLYQHDADDSYVTLIGRGVIIADRALLRARWQPAWNQFAPMTRPPSWFSSTPTASSSGCAA